MKEKIIGLKNKIDQNYEILLRDCELVPLIYPTLEIIIEIEIPDDILLDWFNTNKSTIEMIEKKIENI